MKLKFEKALVVGVALLFPLCHATMSQSKGLVLARRPQLTTLPAFREAHCTVTSRQIRICKAISDDASLLIIQRHGKQIASWPASSFIADTADFQVLEADLDRDGRSELIVANHTGTSCGMGVRYWTIYIFPDPEFRGPQDPLTFDATDYGARGTFVAHRDGIRVLTTRWLGSEDPQGKRQMGLYLVGQWWRYQSGQLRPVTTPLLARRYLQGFANTRARSLGHWDNDSRAPYLWFSNRWTETMKVNPLTGPEEKDVMHGVLERVSTHSMKPDTHLELIFKSSDGRRLTFKYPGDYREPSTSFNYIGDEASRRVYPDNYFPTALEKLWTGRRARLVTYGKGGQVEGQRVLWLEPR